MPQAERISLELLLPPQEIVPVNLHFDDFTEKNYRAFVRRAREAYEIVPFVEHGRDGKICLWRHDIDFSVHRAHALATIESEEEVRASYFVLVHGNFYRLL